jgi:hypothetical protein
MMLMGEAFAALGYNAWVSTFCPFFRLESAASNRRQSSGAA